MMELEFECTNCNGEGMEPDPEYNNPRYRRTCLGCLGKGYIVTEEGDALLAFLKRHFDITVSLIKG